MKIASGPVTLELNGDGSDAGYVRWRDYHKSYPSKQRVVYVHQLLAIAYGADPYKVFSDGDYEVHHHSEVEWDNRPGNLFVETHEDHFDIHFNGGRSDRTQSRSSEATDA